MKLTATIGEEKKNVLVHKEGDTVTAEIDGKKYVLESLMPEPNLYLLKHKNKVFEVFVGGTETFHVSVNNSEFEIAISDPKSLRGSTSSSSAAQGMAEIKTAMPGKVVRVLLEAGAEVEEGQGIVVIEAMKMQNEMKSPKAGVLQEIRFSEGETVNAGDVLAVID